MEKQKFIDRFRRRGWWQRGIRPADTDVKLARREGETAGEERTVWANGRRLEGPGVAKFTYSQEANIERTVADLEEDLAPLIQALSPTYAKYQGAAAKYARAVDRLGIATRRLEESTTAREKNLAQLEVERASREADELFDECEALRLEAEENGLPDLRIIQGKRLAEALRRRAHQDYLRSAFIEGACSVLGVECDVDRIGFEATTTVLDAFIEQLQGNSAADGRWDFDFTSHLPGGRQRADILASVSNANR